MKREIGERCAAAGGLLSDAPTIRHATADMRRRAVFFALTLCLLPLPISAQSYLDSLIQHQRLLHEQEMRQQELQATDSSQTASQQAALLHKKLTRSEQRELERRQSEDNKRREQRMWRVLGVHLTGNKAYTHNDIKSLMELKPKSRYTSYLMNSDLEALSMFYRNGGFEHVDVKLSKVERDSANRKVSVYIAIEEGPRICVSEVSVNAARFASRQMSWRRLATKLGAPLIHSDVRQDCRKIKDILGQHGFLEAIVEPEVFIDTIKNQASVAFNVTEGPLVEIGNIKIEAKGFKRRVVRRELTIKRGDTLNIRSVRQSERNLYTTGLFNYVHIKPIFDSAVAPIDLPDSVYDVQVRVTRGEYVRAQAGLGYSTDEGARVSSSVVFKNVFALGQSATLSGKLSQVSQDAEAVYVIPWIFYLPLQLDTKVYFHRYDNPRLYQGIFDGLRLSAGRQTNFDLLYQIWSQWEEVRWVRAPDEDAGPEGVPEYPTQSIGGNIAYDIRNDLFNPTKGGYVSLGLEVAGVFGGNSNKFIKATLDSRVYFSRRSRYYLSMAARTGYVVPYGSSDVVPVQSKFYGGGSNTVRGFPVDRLAVLPNGDPLKGNYYVFLNIVDVRTPLFWWVTGDSFLNWINIAAFLDAGNIWPNFSDISSPIGFLDDLRWSIGPGLRVDTPIKLVARLDFGFKIDRRPGESLMEMHFDLGQPF